jgi:phenylalanyl-tRNA synthetase beta chain
MYRRYDLLCFEGIALMLNVFLERKALPEYKLVPPANGQLEEIIVKEDVGSHRVIYAWNTC